MQRIRKRGSKETKINYIHLHSKAVLSQTKTDISIDFLKNKKQGSMSRLWLFTFLQTARGLKVKTTQ